MQKNNEAKLELNKTTISNLETNPPSTPETPPDKDVIKQPDTALIKPEQKPVEPGTEIQP